MPTVNQREVFDRPPAGVRKIILATNIAETRYLKQIFFLKYTVLYFAKC